ncbi:MAG TPA: DUF5658 family protein [Candidatus Binatia bacterium]|jgi:hypothetical protein
MSIPTVWSYLSVNLLLQAFDGVLTYRVLSLGIPEANPLVSASIAQWGELWGLLLWKMLACVLLLVIFRFRHQRQSLTIQAYRITGGVYGWFGVLSLCELLVNLDV